MSKKPYQIRIDKDLLEQIKKQAEKEHRSVANMIEFAMKEYLARTSQKQK